MRSVFIASIGTLACAHMCVAQHNHITVDTVSGSPGDQIIIKAGYLPNEGDFTIENGYLMHMGEIAEYDVALQLSQAGMFHDWFAGDEILLTSDFFLATGRLDNGDFGYEIAAITPLSGTTMTTLAWGDFGTGGSFSADAISTGATRAERSFHVGIGGHQHDQGFAFDTGGMYDVTFVAWDSNGVYTDSDPVTIRFHVESGCSGDCDGNGVLNIFDYICFGDEYANGHPYADCDGNGVLNIFDYICFGNAYATGCP